MPQRGPAPEEQDAIHRAQTCILDCHIDQLITETKFLPADSLAELLKVRLWPLCVCACVCVRACVRAWVRACVCGVCVHARACMYSCVGFNKKKYNLQKLLSTGIHLL